MGLKLAESSLTLPWPGCPFSLDQRVYCITSLNFSLNICYKGAMVRVEGLQDTQGMVLQDSIALMYDS